MEQEVPLEAHARRTPVLLIASTWKDSASGLGDQDTTMAPASHWASTTTSCGAQGAEDRERGKERQNSRYEWRKSSERERGKNEGR